jgi:hypothetical protein
VRRAVSSDASGFFARHLRYIRRASACLDFCYSTRLVNSAITAPESPANPRSDTLQKTLRTELSASDRLAVGIAAGFWDAREQHFHQAVEKRELGFLCSAVKLQIKCD